jgi:hypothetical protein
MHMRIKIKLKNLIIYIIQFIIFIAKIFSVNNNLMFLVI